MSEYYWPVVPISKGQALDVRPEDLVLGGYFRACNTYRGGGGYDQFPAIAARRGLGGGHHKQFVVQLRGCTLDCPYCYVTREGVWGKPVYYSSKQLADIFATTEASVFHLMGGAPALYMDHWPELLDTFEALDHRVFHSDLLLTERPYRPDVLKQIARPQVLLAVDIKGMTNEEHVQNTRKPFNEPLLWDNLGLLLGYRVPFYLTFTNVAPENQRIFWQECDLRQFPISAEHSDWFSIELVKYDALRHVDDVPWGGCK